MPTPDAFVEPGCRHFPGSGRIVGQPEASHKPASGKLLSNIGEQFEIIFPRWSPVASVLGASVAIVEVHQCLLSPKAEDHRPKYPPKLVLVFAFFSSTT